MKRNIRCFLYYSLCVCVCVCWAPGLHHVFSTVQPAADYLLLFYSPLAVPECLDYVRNVASTNGSSNDFYLFGATPGLAVLWGVARIVQIFSFWFTYYQLSNCCPFTLTVGHFKSWSAKWADKLNGRVFMCICCVWCLLLLSRSLCVL